jgi:chromosome segregation ATPase
MISSALSQQRLSDSTVIVPIKSLKNALLVKTDRDNLKKELKVARDSISTMGTVIHFQDSALFVCDTTRTVLESKIGDLKGTIKAKDGQIEERNKKISDLEGKLKKVVVALALASIGFVLAIL